jgi:hypothetical protein
VLTSMTSTRATTTTGRDSNGILRITMHLTEGPPEHPYPEHILLEEPVMVAPDDAFIVDVAGPDGTVLCRQPREDTGQETRIVGFQLRQAWTGEVLREDS